MPSNEALSGVVIRCAAARQWQEALQLLRQLRGKGSVPGIGDLGDLGDGMMGNEWLAGRGYELPLGLQICPNRS